MSVPNALRLVTDRLKAVGVEAPRREARMILAAALSTDAAGLLLRNEIDAAAFEVMVKRREMREPLAYILGHKEFWGLEFSVSDATLIPRPETETLIEAALEAFEARDTVRRILDLGTGTGCLLLAALHEFEGAFGVGIDFSPQAAALARDNAVSLGLAARTGFIAGDWSSAVKGRFDLILSNPPYIPAQHLAGLMPEVRQFEPESALDGGKDGLDAYRAIIAELSGLLAPSGKAILELGIGQQADVTILAESAGFITSVRADLAGIPRALLIRAVSD